MPLNRDSSGTANLSKLLETLCQYRVEFIVVGGLAAVIQGVPVTTIDLDIVHHQTEKNIKKLSEFLKSADAYYRRPDDKRIEPDVYALSAKGHILLSTQFGPLDILAIIEKDLGYKELLPNSVEIEFRGYKIRVLKLETMIELKRDSNDAKNIYRMPILEETLRRIK